MAPLTGNEAALVPTIGNFSMLDRSGNELSKITSAQDTLVFESFAPGHPSLSSQGRNSAVFSALNQSDDYLLLDSIIPSEKVDIKVELLDVSGAVQHTSSVSLAFVDASITHIWSEQFFAGRRSNSLPGNSGLAENVPISSQTYILMGNREDDRTYVGGELSLVPDNPALRSRFMFRLATAPLTVSEPITIQSGGGSVELPAAQGVSHIYGSSYHRVNREFSVSANGYALPRSTQDLTIHTALSLAPMVTPPLLGIVPPYLERFLVGGIDHNDDGIVDPNEARIAYKVPNSAVDQGVVFHRGQFSLSRGSSVKKYNQGHFKVVGRETAAANQVAATTISGFFSILTGLFDEASLLLLGNGEFMYGYHALAFSTGVMPLNPHGIQTDGPRNVSDLPRATRIRLPAGNAVLPGQELVSVPMLNHHCGAFDESGIQRVPAYRYPSNGNQSNRVVRTSLFRSLIAINMASNVNFVEAVRQAAGTAHSAGRQEFSVAFRSKADNLPISGDFKGEVLTHPDLFAAIGGFRLGDIECIAHFRINLSPGESFVSGQTECSMLYLDGNFELSDLYDWELDINPLMALIQAGNGSYSIAGQPFIVTIPYVGILPVSSNPMESADPLWDVFPFAIK
jgi:hypothetical protein